MIQDTRLDRLEAALVRLAEAQARTEERLTRLEEAQTKTEQALAELTRRVDQVEEQIRHLVTAVQRLTDTVAALRGDWVEARYRQHPARYFARLLTAMHVIPDTDLEVLATIEERTTTRISAADRDEVLALDLLLEGRDRQTHEPRALAVEISGVIDRLSTSRDRPLQAGTHQQLGSAMVIFAP